MWGKQCLPSTNYAFFPTFCVERLAKTFYGLIDLVDIAICDLEGLRIAVDGSNGVFHDISPGLKADKRTLYLLGEQVELVKVGI